MDALREAEDCVRFLKPLKPHVLKVTDCLDFATLSDAFGPLMQTMLLIWKHSTHFKSSAKLLSLVKRLGNALLAQAQQFLPGLSIPLKFKQYFAEHPLVAACC